MSGIEIIIIGFFLIIFFSIDMFIVFKVTGSISMIVGSSIFVLIGALLIYAGIVEEIIKKKINEHGIKCYGIVKRVLPTGEYSGDKEGGREIVQIVNPNTNLIEDIRNIIDYGRQKSPTNTYVLCKYYEKKIIILENLAAIEVPEKIKNLLIPAPKRKFESLEFSPDGNTVTIDGVEYEKIS